VRSPVRACPPNAQRTSHLRGGVSFFASGVATAALPCKFQCKMSAETWGFADFYKWHANCIMLEKDGGY